MVPPVGDPVNFFKFEPGYQQQQPLVGRHPDDDGDKFHSYLQQVSPISPVSTSVPRSLSPGGMAGSQQRQFWTAGYNPLE